MFILLYGPNTFLSRQQLKKSLEDFKKQRDPSGLNVNIFDAEKTEVSLILENLVASPFLAEKRLVVIERALSKGKKDLLDTLWQMIEQKKIPASSVVIFWEEELSDKKPHPFSAWLKEQKYSKFFSSLTSGELNQWIKNELAKEEMGMENLALSSLVAHPLAEDLWRLNNELQKLILFAKQKEIYAELLEIDKRAKTGEGDYRLLLDLLVNKICS